MRVIWFKNRPKPIALTLDGRLNLVPFKLDPDTIAINGIEGLVAKDSKSEGTFEQVLGLFQATAGSREDPLIVEGEALGGNGVYIRYMLLLQGCLTMHKQLHHTQILLYRQYSQYCGCTSRAS